MVYGHLGLRKLRVRHRRGKVDARKSAIDSKALACMHQDHASYSLFSLAYLLMTFQFAPRTYRSFSILLRVMGFARSELASPRSSAKKNKTIKSAAFVSLIIYFTPSVVSLL